MSSVDKVFNFIYLLGTLGWKAVILLDREELLKGRT